MTRCETQLLPTYTAEIEEIRANGITPELLSKIILKHLPNANYNKNLYDRYMTIYGGVPIFERQPRYEEENPINNRINNDFMSEIVDFKVGYFAGEPISYSYSQTDESEVSTGGEKGVDKASKVLTDFTTRNNMFGVDMETTKNASIYGYSGRLFYIDKEGTERVMPIHGFETIILSDTAITEPEFAIRYYQVSDINDVQSWRVEFYDSKNITVFKGEIESLEIVEMKPHLFDYCPLQGIPNNAECMGDAEKVLNLIDDYDKVLSDNSNEIEAFVHALLLVNLNAEDSVVKQAQKSGSMIIPPVGTNQNRDPVKWLTKEINDAFTEHHLQRLEGNIYRFSQTPNMNDDIFASSSGIALKFRLHGLETKCAAFEASVMNAAQYMWRVLASSWSKKGTHVDPLQIVMEFHRNFPLDSLSEAQTAQAQIAAGLPKRFVFGQLSAVDDVEYIMDLLKEEQEEVAELYPALPTANDSNEPDVQEDDEETQDDEEK